MTSRDRLHGRTCVRLGVAVAVAVIGTVLCSVPSVSASAARTTRPADAPPGMPILDLFGADRPAQAPTRARGGPGASDDQTGFVYREGRFTPLPASRVL
jgi:hypothetical protein